MKRILILFAVLAAGLFTLLWQQESPVQAQEPNSCILPELEYLGEGDGIYELPDGYTNFIVKKFSPFRFETFEGPIYESTRRSPPRSPERVWACGGDRCLMEVPSAFEGEIPFGFMPAGAEVIIPIIDNDIDQRIPDIRDSQGNVIERIPDFGLTEFVSFTAPYDDSFTLYSPDSVGAFEPCLDPDPEPTPTPTATEIFTPTPTLTVTLTVTPTITPTVMPTVTPTETPVVPINTPTETPEQPTATPTETPELPTATPTETPVETTATATATPTSSPTSPTTASPSPTPTMTSTPPVSGQSTPTPTSPPPPTPGLCAMPEAVPVCANPEIEIADRATVAISPSGQSQFAAGSPVTFTALRTSDTVGFSIWRVNGEDVVGNEALTVTMPKSCTLAVEAVFTCAPTALDVTHEPRTTVFLPLIENE